MIESCLYPEERPLICLTCSRKNNLHAHVLYSISRLESYDLLYFVVGIRTVLIQVSTIKELNEYQRAYIHSVEIAILCAIDRGLSIRESFEEIIEKYGKD